MRPLFIIGYMGAGKTTFGKALANATSTRFIDLDDYIEERSGTSIPDIFARHGEQGFREMERDCLLEICDTPDCIVSCGGGTPCFFNNMEIMNIHGTTVWLRTSEERLLSRLAEAREKRPLLAGKSDHEIRAIISSQLREREPFYSMAHHSWQGDSLEDLVQIEGNIAGFIISPIYTSHKG